MKTLFLDIHEVLTINGKFSPSAVKNLKELLQKIPELQIVVSSTLRYKGLKFVKKLLSEQGIDSKRIVGITDTVNRDDRGHHIERYIKDHEVDQFVIFDDRDDMDKILDHLVQINPFIGLTEADVNKAIDILEKTK